MKKRTHQPRRAPLRITWTGSEKLALLLALMGFQIKYVAGRTELTPGQVYYRLRKLDLGTLRRDYRTGESPLAKRVMNTNSAFAMQLVTQRLRLTGAIPTANKRRAA